MGGMFGGMGGGMGGPPGGGMGGGAGGSMFDENKLKQNPRIAKYFEDPQFVQKFQMCQMDPQIMMKLMQTDARMQDVFKEATGIDLGDMQEK